MPIVSMPTYGPLVSQVNQFDPVAALAQQRKIQAQTLENQKQDLANKFTQATQPGSISAENAKNGFTLEDLQTLIAGRKANTAETVARTPGIQAQSGISQQELEASKRKGEQETALQPQIMDYLLPKPTGVIGNPQGQNPNGTMGSYAPQQQGDPLAALYGDQQGAMISGFSPAVKSIRDAKIETATNQAIPSALADISEVSKMPGDTRENARLKSAALSGLQSKYPYLSNDPRFKDAIATATPKNPDAVFNMQGIDMMTQMRKGNALAARLKSENDKYDKQINSLENIRSVRFNDDGSENPAWGKGAADVSLINQLSTGEYAGYKPTAQEYTEFGSKLSVPDIIQKWKERVQNGAVIPNDIRENMYNEILRVAKRNHQNFSKTLGNFTEQAKKQGIEDYVIPSGTYEDVHQFFKNQPHAGSQGSASTQTDTGNKTANGNTWK